MPVTPEAHEKFLQYMAKNYNKPGSGIVERPDGRTPKIPMISKMQTWAMTGGIPIGHMALYEGSEGAGKSLTNLSLMYCAQNYNEVMTNYYESKIRALQKRKKKIDAIRVKKELKHILTLFPDGMQTMFFDTEQRFDWDFAERLGVDPSKITLMEENVIEDIIRQMTAGVEAFHLIIVDSVSNAQSYAEATLDPEAYERGTAAAAWKRLRQVRKRLDRNANTIVMINQMRSFMGQSPGGRGPKQQGTQIRFIKHNVSLRVEYSAGGMLYFDKNMALTDDWEKASTSLATLGTDGKEPAGLEIRGKVMKNSTGKPYRNFRTRFRHDWMDMESGELIQEVGFDENFELFEMATVFGMIKTNGSGRYYVVDKDKEETGQKAHGKPAAMKMIGEDEDLRSRIIEQLIIST